VLTRIVVQAAAAVAHASAMRAGQAQVVRCHPTLVQARTVGLAHALVVHVFATTAGQAQVARPHLTLVPA
jgi:hypothetical protein